MQSSSTRQSKPRSLASRTVVLTQTSVVTPQTISRADAAAAQHRLKIGGVECALARLVHDGFAGLRRQFGDDVVARLAAHQDATHGTEITYAGREPAADALGRGEVGQVGAMALTGMDHEHSGRTAGAQHPLGRCDG